MDKDQRIDQLTHLCHLLHTRLERSLTQSALKSKVWKDFNQEFTAVLLGKTENVSGTQRLLADPKLKTIRQLIPDHEYLEQTITLFRGSTALLDPEDPAPVAVATVRKLADKLEVLLDK
jgi:hypothetical protein